MVEGGAGAITDAVGGGNGFAVGKNASPEAVDFVKFMTSAENQAALAKIGVAIPVVKGGEVGLSDPLMIQFRRPLRLRSTSNSTTIKRCPLPWAPSSTTAPRVSSLVL